MDVTLQRMLVGVDGSDDSLAAVRWAADLASATGAARSWQSTCSASSTAWSRSGAVPVESHLGEIRDRFERDWCAPLTGLSFRTELRYGSPVGVLLDLADETDADLIVLGSRGLGGFPELLLGSTSSQVAQHSRRAVLIVPRPAMSGSPTMQVPSTR